MKNAHDIISSLQNRPQFSKLSRFKCIDTIRLSFNAPLQRMIKFAYIKNNILFFVLNHPGAKQEFDNNIQSIKSALKFAKPDACQELNITDIKAFVTHTPSRNKPVMQQKQIKQIYHERAEGNFEISVKDEKLNQLIKSIRDIIKEKNATA